MGLALSGMDVGLSSPKKRPVSSAKSPYDGRASTESGGNMKKSATFLLSMVLALYTYSGAFAQGKGKGETRANANGQRGIENAETKQARDKDDSGKKMDKGKSKGKKQGHAFGRKK